MQQALRYTDEKSDKFWRIETAGCELVINWGKPAQQDVTKSKLLIQRRNVKSRNLSL